MTTKRIRVPLGPANTLFAAAIVLTSLTSRVSQAQASSGPLGFNTASAVVDKVVYAIDSAVDAGLIRDKTVLYFLHAMRDWARLKGVPLTIVDPATDVLCAPSPSRPQGFAAYADVYQQPITIRLCDHNETDPVVHYVMHEFVHVIQRRFVEDFGHKEECTADLVAMEILLVSDWAQGAATDGNFREGAYVDSCPSARKKINALKTVLYQQR